ncbi:MAG: DUF4062 domain-containing protein [Defluviitaleaceae bacterium]|nr:DUF4062 domain-containing protein [Defluviitaleaceae bacterium]
MAIPKVMISSTCYDLKQIRENLDSFIRSMGYEPLRSDKGDVGYNIAETLKDDCFLLAQQCDILVGIIGGIFGSEASQNDSVTMAEMKTALEHKKQIYIFVDTNVLTEYRTYKLNLDKKGEDFAKKEIMYSYVNDTRIFDFVNDMYNHESERVVIVGFQIASEISEFLKKQWANLFQASLSQKERDSQSGAYSKINESAVKLEELINKFDNNLLNLSEGTSYMLENQGLGRYLANPLLGHLKKLLKTNLSVLFKTSDELVELMGLFSYEEDYEDDDIHVFATQDECSGLEIKITISKSIFDDGKLIFPDTNVSLESYISLEEIPQFDPFASYSIEDDDLPF